MCPTFCIFYLKNIHIKIYKTIILPGSFYGYETSSHMTAMLQNEGVWDRGAEENICAWEVWSDSTVEVFT
jgi:hypothetical protein